MTTMIQIDCPNNMKLRRLSTQRKQHIHSPLLNNTLNPKIAPPISRIPRRSPPILTQNLQTIDIDLRNSITSGNGLAKVNAILQMQHRLKQRASEFISKIRKDKIHQMGRAIMRKQQQEQNKQIKQEIERCSQIIKEEQELIKRRHRANDKVRIFQARQKERKMKTIQAQRHKTSDVLPSPKRIRLSSENHLKHRTRLLVPNQMEQYRLKNSIYLDEEQQKIEQTRKMLHRLSAVIDGVHKIKQKC